MDKQQKMSDPINMSIADCSHVDVENSCGVQKLYLKDIRKLHLQKCGDLPTSPKYLKSPLKSSPMKNESTRKIDCKFLSPIKKSPWSSPNKSSPLKLFRSPRAVLRSPLINAYNGHYLPTSSTPNVADVPAQQYQRTLGTRRRLVFDDISNTSLAPAPEVQQKKIENKCLPGIESSLSIVFSDRENWQFTVHDVNKDLSDTESIWTIQSKETELVQDTEDDLWFLSDEEIENTSNSENIQNSSEQDFEEFEVESYQSSSSDGELSSSVSCESICEIYDDHEETFWADFEPSESETDMEAETNTWTCGNCKTTNLSSQQFCEQCWNIQDGWVAKGLKQNKSRPKKLTPLHASCSEVTQQLPTDGLPEKMSTAGGLKRTSSTDTLCLSEIDEEAVRYSLHTTRDSGIGSSFMENTCVASPQIPPAKKRKRKSRRKVLGQLGTSSKKDEVDTNPVADPCTICLTKPKEASLIHGKSGHQICCYKCGKHLKQKRKPCPLCRRPIQKVIRNYLV